MRYYAGGVDAICTLLNFDKAPILIGSAERFSSAQLHLSAS